jgi:hypothetical protein
MNSHRAVVAVTEEMTLIVIVNDHRMTEIHVVIGTEAIEVIEEMAAATGLVIVTAEEAIAMTTVTVEVALTTEIQEVVAMMTTIEAVTEMTIQARHLDLGSEIVTVPTDTGHHGIVNVLNVTVTDTVVEMAEEGETSTVSGRGMVRNSEKEMTEAETREIVIVTVIDTETVATDHQRRTAVTGHGKGAPVLLLKIGHEMAANDSAEMLIEELGKVQTQSTIPTPQHLVVNLIGRDHLKGVEIRRERGNVRSLMSGVVRLLKVRRSVHD